MPRPSTFARTFRPLAAGVIALAGLTAITASDAARAQPDEIPHAPQPDAAQPRWQLDVEFGDLVLTSAQDKEGNLRAYFCLTYKVVNNTGEDLVFAPTFDLATDEGHSVRSGRDVPPEVSRELIERLENPLMLDQIQVLGMILQGEENAKEGMAIWPADDLNVDEIRVFAAGFSGENRTEFFPDPDGSEPVKVVFRKSLLRVYRTPGELHPDDTNALDLTETYWIMR